MRCICMGRGEERGLLACGTWRRRRRTSHLAAVSWESLNSLVSAVSLSVTATASLFSSSVYRHHPFALSVPLTLPPPRTLISSLSIHLWPLADTRSSFEMARNYSLGCRTSNPLLLSSNTGPAPSTHRIGCCGSAVPLS